jgi:hypothetical protein
MFITAFRRGDEPSYGQMLEHVERFLRLKAQIEQLRRRRPKVKELHLSPSGRVSQPRAAVMEKAYLMQLRLHLEAQLESGRSG